MVATLAFAIKMQHKSCSSPHSGYVHARHELRAIASLGVGSEVALALALVMRVRMAPQEPCLSLGSALPVLHYSSWAVVVLAYVQHRSASLHDGSCCLRRAVASVSL